MSVILEVSFKYDSNGKTVRHATKEMPGRILHQKTIDGKTRVTTQGGDVYICDQTGPDRYRAIQ